PPPQPCAPHRPICVAMIGGRNTTSALTLLVLLDLFSLIRVSTSTPLTAGGRGLNEGQERGPLPGPTAPHGEGEPREGGPLVRGEEVERGKEEEDELFKDVDPRTLAAVLLQALNKPEGGRWTGGEGEEEKKEEQEKEERAAEGADRDRDGRQELELVMAAAQGKEEREREEEEEKKKAQEEEERLTEKVTSRTSSQTVPVKKEQAATLADGGEGEGGGGGEEVTGKEVGAREEEEEEEEQLSPEEVKNLETMMEEFQSYSTANKREREREMEKEREEERNRESLVQRESRGYSQEKDQGLLENEIKSKPNGHQLALSKKKLKWQEETQKGLNFPTFRGGNFMDDFDNNLAQRQHPAPAPAEEDAEEEEEEEALSLEEEEARARAEQEEVGRQAAEAQRAKAEEEKLADIASDMLLRYMVKQDRGGRKYADKNRKKALSFSDGNAAEDKRSDEEAVAGGDDDDDIDPQTIDKLIEISSKLHLPADDVVDIISDVEKKKKKDAPGGPEGGAGSPWLRPLVVSNSVQDFPSLPRSSSPKQASPPVNPLKAWFKEKLPMKHSQQDPWVAKPPKPFLGPSTSYPSSYPSFPAYQKPYRGYYPVYFPPPKPPKSRYYQKPQAPLSLSDFLGNSLDYELDFSPKRRYHAWVQPRQRKPPSPSSLRRNLYFPSYALPPRQRTFSPYPVPAPKPRAPSWGQGRRRPAYFYPPPAPPLVSREEDYYGQAAPRSDSTEDLENYIQQVLRKRPRMFQ
ncbi:neurosecretory protein VGF, partial [Osmerus eperlanus]|uniref:neurosecretory protein VGF n=1 Tax=Osmerus eperlanus TaxID=29151 RepID=UPI002E1345F0